MRVTLDVTRRVTLERRTYLSREGGLTTISQNKLTESQTKMNRLGQASLFAVALLESANALKTMTKLHEELGDTLESLEEDGSSALYYSPEDQMIYEVTTDADMPQTSTTTVGASTKGLSTQDVINQEPGNMSIDQMIAAGLIEEVSD